MKKSLLMVSLMAALVLPALSFSEVRIGIGIPIGGPPVYAQPAPQGFQGMIVQSYPGNVVLRCADGRRLNFFVTPQTQVYGGLAVGSVVNVNAYPADGGWYAQSVNTVYANYAQPAPYPVYPAPVYDEPYYGYGYPGYIRFGFGFGGRGDRDDWGHDWHGRHGGEERFSRGGFHHR